MWTVEVGDRVTAREDTGASDEAAVCCSVLQCVAVCCSVLQCVAVTADTGDSDEARRVAEVLWVLLIDRGHPRAFVRGVCV